MKKFLVILLFACFIGNLNQAKAQCNGASVLITNIVITNVGLTYNFSYNWKYVNGNASIAAALLCNGVEVAVSACNADLHGQSGGDPVPVFFYSGSVTFPSACSGLKEIQFRIYASANCHGNYCLLPALSPLPVTFSSFTTTRNSSNVLLKWSTAYEHNNSGFMVERNVNGTWQDIAWVPSPAVGGNSDALISYSYSDQNSTKGITQYRIRQVDLDSKYKYSDVRSVRGDGQMGKIIVYPNPSNNGRISVSFEDVSASRNVSVMDLSGRTIKEYKGVNNNNITIENLQPGMYTIKVSVPETGEQAVQKVVVNQR